MADTDHHIPDFDVFERYYSGEMPAAEQRTLEGRMLEEPLIAEAFEGFLAWRAQHADAARVRADLRERLNARIVPARGSVLPLWAYASAASVVLGLFTYWTVFLRDEKVEMRKPLAVIKQESVLPEEKVPVTIQKEKQTAPVASAPKPAVPVPAQKTSAAPQKPNPQPLFTPETSVAAVAAEAAAAQEEALNATVPYSVPAEKTVEQLAPKPAKALATPGSAEAVAKSMAARPRTEPSPLHTVAGESEPVDTPGLAEVVVVDLSANRSKRKKTATAGTASPDTLAPAPAQGWPAYRTYLDKNTGGASATGQVLVTFVVGPSGALSGFTAKGPEDLQKEAIRIISNGPAWLPARTKGTSVAALAEIQLQFRQSQ